LVSGRCPSRASCQPREDRVTHCCDERLESVGVSILNWVLVSETIGLVRPAIAEARRLPALASRVNRMARERGEESGGSAFARSGSIDELGKLPAVAPERLATTMGFFLNLVVVPLFLRALYGEKLKVLRGDRAAGSAQCRFFCRWVPTWRRQLILRTCSAALGNSFLPQTYPSSRGSRCLCCAKHQSI
jgi:hypothetical protein